MQQKKIVALVLCLVLALSLATVAFAATTSTELKAADYKVMDMKNTALDKVTAIKVTTQDNDVNTVSGKTETTYHAVNYTINGADYSVVDSASADYKLVKGSEVIYLVKGDLTTKTEVTSAAAAAKKVTCGDAYKLGTDGTTKEGVATYVIDSKTVLADGASWAVYNGKFVKYGAEATVLGHEFKAADKVTDTTGKLVKVACATCKNTYDAVEAAKVPASYLGKVQAIDGVQAGYVALIGTATAADKTVESAKTFDAGIALYAGMALASVAGSAVVIGKKKEF